MLSFLKKRQEPEEKVRELKAYISGKVIPIEEVADEVFSSKALGDGIGIEPTGDTVYAPCSGTVSVVMADSKQAVGMTLNNGAEILIHEGLDTVNMQGEGFEVFVKEGDKVAAGQKLIQFDSQRIRECGYGLTCVLVVTNMEEFPGIRFVTGEEAVQGETTVVVFEA